MKNHRDTGSGRPLFRALGRRRFDGLPRLYNAARSQSPAGVTRLNLLVRPAVRERELNDALYCPKIATRVGQAALLNLPDSSCSLVGLRRHLNGNSTVEPKFVIE